jgi:hypothetical protein
VAGFNEAQHPRVPAGNTTGGRFTSGGGGVAMPDDEEIRVAAKNYGRYTINGKKVAFASEAVIRGQSQERFLDNDPVDMTDVNAPEYLPHPDDYRDAKVLVDAVRASEPKEQVLYRGISSFNQHAGLQIAKLKPGDTIALGRITSFSSELMMAGEYAHRDGGQGILVVLKGTSQTFATDAFTGMGHNEHITHGKFRVISVGKPPPVHTPVLNKQSDKYEYKKTNPFNKMYVIEQEAVF